LVGIGGGKAEGDDAVAAAILFFGGDLYVEVLPPILQPPRIQPQHPLNRQISRLTRYIEPTKPIDITLPNHT